MKTGKPKMSDIAKALHISDISVSRALSGQEGVSAQLREKVLRTAGEMGYFKPKSRADTHVLVLHQKPFVQDNGNYSHMIQGVEKALQDVGCTYDIEFVDKENQEKPRLPVRLQKGVSYDGALLIGHFEPAFVAQLGGHIPHAVYFTGCQLSDHCDGVWYHFSGGAYELCRHLFENGHRKIGYVGSRGTITGQKLLGVASALEDRGLALDGDHIFYGEDSYGRLEELLRAGGLTAVVCRGDHTAVRLIQYLYQRGIRVPEQLSVVGSGNSEMSSLCSPALTTMELHIGYACEAAVELLLRRLARPDKPAENICIAGTLVERDSVLRLEPSADSR